MKANTFVSFLLKSIFMGLILSGVLLFLVPQLRQSNGQQWSMFSAGQSASDRVSFHHAVRSAAPAVVDIFSKSIQSSPVSYGAAEIRNSLGSGVIMREDGYIVTCYHVIQDAERILVRLYDGRVLEAQVVGADRPTDLAVLKVEEGNLPVVAQTDNPDIQVGDVVLAIGNPLNLGQNVTQGIVSASGRAGMSNVVGSRYVDYIRMDAVLNEGNSGGALIDSNGILVGINNAVFKTRDNQGRVSSVAGVYFAVPYELAKKVMDSLIANGRVIRGFLGITGVEPRDQEGKIQIEGIYVTDVDPLGPAAQAGIQAQDVLTRVNNQPIANIYQVLDIVAESAPGTVITFQILRANRTLSVAVTLGEMKAS